MIATTDRRIAELEAARDHLIEAIGQLRVRREAQLAEAWDEVERLRGVVERLELEKFDLAERLMKAGSKPT